MKGRGSTLPRTFNGSLKFGPMPLFWQDIESLFVVKLAHTLGLSTINPFMLNSLTFEFRQLTYFSDFIHKSANHTFSFNFRLQYNYIISPSVSSLRTLIFPFFTFFQTHGLFFIECCYIHLWVCNACMYLTITFSVCVRLFIYTFSGLTVWY